MKINTQSRDGNKVTIEISEDYAAFEKAVTKEMARTAKEITLPGFRQGKAPKEMVEKAIVREAVEAHAAQELISTLYPQVITEAKIEPVDYPNVEIVTLEKGKPIVFKIIVEVYPEVKLGKYKGLKAEKKAVAVADEDINKVLGSLQQRFSQPKADGTKEEVALDDEFAKKVSRFGTLGELKEELRQAMLKDREAEAEADLKNKLIAAASADTKVDIPKGMIDREVSIMLDELRGSLAQSGLTVEDYLKGIKKEESSLREELSKPAETRVKGKVILRAIAEEEKLEIGQAEIDAELQAMALESGQPLEELKKRLDQGAAEYIQDYLLRKKALELLVEKAKLEEAKA